jgi:hypothetical protein
MKAWLETLSGAVAFLASLCLSFAAVPKACAARSSPLLIAIPLAAIAVTLLGGALSWRRWRGLGGDFPGEASASGERALASGGVLLNGFFVLVLLAQMVAPAVLGVCE